MLSRVAERTYWLARYLERAENSARLILVRHHSVLDLPREVQPGWDLLLKVLGAEADFAALPGGTTEKNIISFVFGERENRSSIISSLSSARENMRTTREILPNETWERVNSLYLSVARRSNKDLPRTQRHSVLNNIIHSCQQITGMLAGTMNQDDAYQFMRLGRNLERADMSSRIIDVGSAALISEDGEASPYRNVLWISVLQSLSAYQMYRLSVQRNVSAADVLNFLLHDRNFPRSLGHTLEQLETSVKRLPHHRPALNQVRAVQRKLATADSSVLAGEDLHDFLDRMQGRFVDIHQAIAASWFGYQAD